MTKIVWSGAQDNNWFNPNNWNPAIVPPAGVTVVIPAGLANYPVIPNGAGVTISQNLTLGGTLTLASTGSLTDLIFNGGAVRTLSGGGSILLSDSANNRIYSNQGGTTLENVDGTISGAGQIFANGGSLSILNDAAGTINASAANNQLFINNILLTNNGLVESTGAAGLLLSGVTLNQSGGGTLSASGGNVYLNSMTIFGGTLQTPSGLIETSGNGTILNGAGQAVTIAAGGTVRISDGTNLTLVGALNDKGTLALASGQDGVHFDLTDFIVNGSTTDKLQGGGVVQLSDSANNRIYSNNANTVLENVDDTISGAGQIFANGGNLSILNDAAGTINASAANNQLFINNILLTNNGLVESTGAAGLLLSGMTLDQSGGGALTASGGNVYLNSMTILGGTLQTPSGLIVTSGSGSRLDGTGVHPITLATGSTLQVSDGTNLSLVGVINDKGTIKLASGQDGVHFDLTDLLVAGSVVDKLQGGGVLQLSDSANNRIYSNNAGTTLENVDDSIVGAGQIFSSGGNLTLVNDAAGVINANAAVNALTLSNIVVNNTGLVEATSTGGLNLNSMTLNNAGGTLSAAGGNVNFNASALVGGALTTTGSSRIQTNGNGALLNGVTISANSAVAVSDGNNLTLTGTINNIGQIQLRSGQDGVHYDLTDLLIQGAGTVTLTGGGAVAMSVGGANRIYSNQAGAILDNINNKIQGTGSIFANSGLSVINESAGSITANNTGQSLTLNSIVVTNTGFIGASNDAALSLTSMTLNQSGAGVLSALQGNVYLSSSHISGGALSGGGGYAVATSGNNTLLDGVASALTVKAGATVRVSDGQNLSLAGTIANSGTLLVDSGQDGVHFDLTDLFIQGAVNLTGGGTVLLSNSGNNRIYSNVGGSVLTNTNNTIIGAGQIFANAGLSIVNAAAGVIEAGAGETLNVSVSIANSGVLGADGGTLNLSGAVTGAGTVMVANGGAVSLSASSSLSSIVYGGPNAGSVRTLLGSAPTINGFAAGDSFYISSSQTISSLAFVENGGNASGVLTFFSGASAVASYTLNGFYTSADFTLVSGGGGYYGALGIGDVWQGGTGAWNAGPWSQGLPGADDDVVINSGAPNVTAGIGTVRSLSALGAGSVDFAGVAGNTVTGTLYDGASFALDKNAGEGGASLTVGALDIAAAGSLSIGNATLSASDTLNAGALDNNGALSLIGAGAKQALLKVSAAAGFGTAGAVGGAVSLSGNSAIVFNGGGLQTVAAGASLSLTGPSAFVSIAGRLGSNSALTGLNSVAGVLSLESGAVIAPTGALYDSGQLHIDDVGAGGTVLTLPTLYVTGALTLGNAGMTIADQLNVTTLRSVGAIALTGGATAQALLNVNSAPNFGAPAGRLFGSLSLSGQSALQFASGAITAIDASGSLREQGNKAFVQVKTAAGSNSALTTLSVNAGSLSLENGASLADTVALSSSGTLSLDALAGEGGSSLSDTLGLTNTGTLTVGNATSSAATTLTAKSLANTGAITVKGAAGFQALVNIGGPAGFGTVGVLTGAVTLAGNAQIKFASGGVTSIAGGASLDLVGSAALLQNNLAGSNTGLKTLSNVSGTLILDGQVTIATTTALANSGAISVDVAGGEGGSSLTATGALTNSGSLTLGNASLSAADLVKASALNNSGALTIIGGASNRALLQVGSAAGFGGAGVLTGAVSLSGNSAIQFASGSISTIAAGASLTMNGPAAFVQAGATNSNSALTTLTADNATLSLHNSIQIASSRAMTVAAGAQFLVDNVAGEGGSNLSFAGALTNSGTLTLGNASLSQNDQIAATALTSTGSITLTGSATQQALLNIGHAAAFGAGTAVTGAVSLTNDAAIAFTSGSLTSVAAGASLTLDGPNAYIEAGAANANNALNALSFNSGAFNLLNGGAVSTGAFSNFGQMQLATTRGTGFNTSLAVAGQLRNTGNLSLLGGANTLANIAVTATSLNNTGTLSLANANAANTTTLTVGGAAGFGTAGFLFGNVTIGANSSISFANGSIGTIGAGATLDLAATTGYLTIGGASSNAALSGLTTVNGTLQIDQASAITTSAGLTNAGTINLDAATGGAGSLTIGGAFVNSGVVNLGAGFNLAASAQIVANSLNNTGALNLSGGGATQALLKINGAAGFGAAGVFKGRATLANNADIMFASGAITSLAAGSTLRLIGAQANVEIGASNSNNALSTLASIAGTLELDNGASVADSANIAIAGALFLDSFAGEGGSTFSDAAKITNSGTLNIGNTSSSANSAVSASTFVNSGTINLTGNGSNHFGQLSVSGGLTNNGAVYVISDVESIASVVAGTGTFDIWNGANLSFAAGVGAAQTVTFDTPGTLGINAAGNVFQAGIAGFGAGDTVNLSNFAGAGASLSYQDSGNHTGVLTITNGANSTLLNFDGDYATTNFSINGNATTATLAFV